MRFDFGRDRAGFTLIELLIVVAIIGILAAIAVPNFMNAQTRAKIGRVKSDMKSLANALEMYQLDYGSYCGDAVDVFGVLKNMGWSNLTTPVAYISTPPPDPFQEMAGESVQENQPNLEIGTGSTRHPNQVGIWHGQPFEGKLNTYLISSIGPDRIDTTVGNYGFQQSAYPWANGTSEKMKTHLFFDASNGLHSFGEICRAGGIKPSGSEYARMSEGYTLLYQNQ
ncbi:prepilin-type N-terminal cleavage/methylation domain-containing protein [bacterium]|nr:prepilin-type N-terminal cleavage/methylation domain-containing protein [bacterium]